MEAAMQTRCHFAWAPVTPDAIVCHGGLRSPEKFKSPLSDVFVVRNGEIAEVLHRDEQVTNSPKLSHHCGLVLRGRYFVLIGGWDGRKRTNELSIFDLNEKKWIDNPKARRDSTPPVGLSGHTAELISEAPIEIVVIGREGGVREQRRFGDAFRLFINENLRSYGYEELPFKVDSRTGHTSCLTRNGLLLIGGRKSDVFQLVKVGNKKSAFNSTPWKVPVKGQMKPLNSLRYHAVTEIDDDVFLVHGGEHFKSRNNVSGDLWMICIGRTGIQSTWLCDTRVRRRGHVIHVTDQGELMCIGGSGNASSESFVVKLLSLSRKN